MAKFKKRKMETGKWKLEAGAVSIFYFPFSRFCHLPFELPFCLFRQPEATSFATPHPSRSGW
jgi:hypothetical protein